MKRQLPPLPALRAFEAAGRHLNFSRAADELHVTQSAVSRQIKVLENYLGQAVFIRLTRKVALTEFGSELHAAVVKGMDTIENALLQARKKKRDVLRISITQSLGSLWLMPRLSSFCEAYPEFDVSVVTSMRPADFAQQDYDVAIRLGRMPGQRYARILPRIPHSLVNDWNGVSAVHLWDEILTPVMSRALLDPRRPLNSPADLMQYKLLHVSVRPDAWPDWFRSRNTTYQAGPSMEFGHFFMALEAAQRGIGIALAPTLLIGDAQANTANNLFCPFPSHVKSAGAYYLLCPEQRCDEKAIRQFRKWLLKQGSAYR